MDDGPGEHDDHQENENDGENEYDNTFPFTRIGKLRTFVGVVDQETHEDEEEQGKDNAHPREYVKTSILFHDEDLMTLTMIFTGDSWISEIGRKTELWQNSGRCRRTFDEGRELLLRHRQRNRIPGTTVVLTQNRV